MTTVAPAIPTAWYWNRWYQLILGFVAMMWIFITAICLDVVYPTSQPETWTTLAELQWTLYLLIILQTWCSPLLAYTFNKFMGLAC